jgi:hypothetical protein
MSTLNIEQVKITDNISERAKTCTVLLAPEERVPAPTAEFSYPGDVLQLTGTSIRPTGTVINIDTSFGSVPSHTIFSGAIETMDDLTDPDKYNYTIVLSNTPANQKHRNKITKIYNQQSYPNCPADMTTVHAIIKDCCRIAGIPFGRCDLPNLNVWGTFEVIRKNPAEVAEELCQPFNLFEYRHYFVRIDETNGLSVIGIDYTEGGKVTNTYALQNIENCNRSYERYMPENRLGDGNIILTGCDVYGEDPYITTVINNDTLGDENTRPADKIGISVCTKEYTQDSRNVGNPENGGSGLDQYSITTTIIEFVIQVTVEATWDAIMGWWTYPSIPPDGTIDSLIVALSTGEVKSVSIMESNVISSHEEQWSSAGAADPSSGGGLLQTVDTSIFYEQKRFPRHIYKATDYIAHVPIREEVLTCVYPKNEAYTRNLSKRYYNYSDTGVHIGTTTQLYNNLKGSWILVSTQTNTENSPSLTSAALQYAADQQAQIAEELDAAQAATANNKKTFTILPTSVGDNNAFNGQRRATFSVIGKHKLINGIPQPITNIPARVGQTNLTGKYGAPLSSYPMKASSLPTWVTSLGLTWLSNQYRQLPGNTIIDPTSAQFEQEQAERNAFHISVPWMDLAGLQYLWGMCLRQRALEHLSPYWDKVKATCSIDTSPTAGESLVVQGSGGICEIAEHILTENDAITTVAVKRLIV